MVRREPYNYAVFFFLNTASHLAFMLTFLYFPTPRYNDDKKKKRKSLKISHLALRLSYCGGVRFYCLQMPNDLEML